MKSYTFANILFSGRCNLRCSYCIGHNQALQTMPENLHIFPLKGLDRFVEQLREHGITQISLTGTNTDPQLYAYEPELLATLRERIPDVKIALHTNGLLALHKIEVFNQYDRATISLPSFQPGTYRQLTGRSQVLDLAAIVQVSTIPLKISTIITEHNINEIPEIVSRCRDLGISRIVLRKQYGDTRNWPLFPQYKPIRFFGGNPVYDLDGMEVTIWDFSRSAVRCLNLFSDGSVSAEYQLTRSHIEYN
ncbi:molybdenum cofactor biosynthesis protein A [Candidatus Vecturithrix granuli]|uniref:Molybdenum cofactor biosynthesis protein A n=1 Tax=Vecturithrix granuli TaxID=1499967 RepID=A0A081BUA6_VECG1|nr:molybdenum cofactor biosynthesis protein A [Candidatus Vecturithrix granuli]